MYRVFGFDWECRDFSYCFDSFIEAVKAYRNLSWATTFITRDSTTSCLFVR